MSDIKKHPSSFKDPAGFIFEADGKVYRQVNKCYAENYGLCESSNLYTSLIKEEKLIAHKALPHNFTGSNDWYITLLPQQLHIVSYPYEWCFDQLRDAALLTLEVLKTSMKHGMVLKDATPFNIEFIKGKPIFIDTLSFEKYDSLKPWVAYRQFVECFFVPLILASYKSTAFIRHLQLHPEGIQTSFAAKMLPFTSRFRLSLFLHIFLPGSIKNKKLKNDASQSNFSQQKLLNIITDLQSALGSLQCVKHNSDWNNYYTETILSDAYLKAKLLIVVDWIKLVRGNAIIDVGTNTGAFALAAAEKFDHVIAIDSDERCINDLYVKCKAENRNNIYPLWVDVTNPTPAIGWANTERESFITRCKADAVMALAVIHHLVIGKNISLRQTVELFSSMGSILIIEFIPKDDPKVEEMLNRRKDVFEEYNEDNFELYFSKEFLIIKKEKIEFSSRTIYLMQKKQGGHV